MDPTDETIAALAQVRQMDQFEWYVIFMFVVVLYIYFTEGKKNMNIVLSALVLYTIHWFVEIINALFEHFLGNALWTVPDGSAFVLLVGVGIELSFMFMIAGIVNTKLLPEDPKKKILGLPAPLAVGLGNALLASVLEIFLARTNAFHWAYPWYIWSTWTVFLTVYIPFFVIAAYAYYWPRKKQLLFLGIGAAINIGMLIAFALVPWLVSGMVPGSWWI